MTFITEHIPQVLVATGVLLLAIEVAILGFATFILFFVGCSMILTGAAVWIGLLGSDLNSILIANAIVTSVLAVALWQPFKKMQNATETKQVKSDFEGVTFVLDADTDHTGKAQHKYSGITWIVKSQQPITAGTEVVITKAEVGVLWVSAV